MIKISGNSNYSVSIIEYNSRTTILKESLTKEDTIRLKKQIQKHNYFLNYYQKYVPKIIMQEDSKYIIEYIKSYDMIDYLNRSNILHIHKYLHEIISLINQFIVQSKFVNIKKSIIIQKINTIKMNLKHFLKKKVIQQGIDFLYQNIEIFNHKIPVGLCHGDLTLSNMLIDYNHNLYLIDFLDDFLNSPIIDIIKLRQDIKYHYILQLYNGKYDKIRIELIFNYMNKIISENFSEYEVFLKYLDIMNFLRILQYSKNEKMDNYLIDTIKLILS